MRTQNRLAGSEAASDDEMDHLEDSARRDGLRNRKPAARDYESTESETEGSDNFIDILPTSSGKRGRKPAQVARQLVKLRYKSARRSTRAGRTQDSMKEMYEDDIPEIDPARTNKHKVVGVKETFLTRPTTDEFRKRHLQACVICGDHHEDRERGVLVFCQSCTDSYHAGCLGSRSYREHLVTKIRKDEFILQCRRCINVPAKKEPTAPHFSKCQGCMEDGPNTKPFRKRISVKEEHKVREENNGEDPITSVDSKSVNNTENIMFRCPQCHRAWHMHHLPPREEELFEIEDQHARAKKRWSDYSSSFSCTECLDNGNAIGGIVAWRPRVVHNYSYGIRPSEISEDEKDYLLKWSNKPYSQSRWMPGAWLWSVGSRTMLSSFFKRQEGNLPPVMCTEDAIPEEYFRVDIVFNVRYNNIVTDKIEEVDLARIREVDEALVKYKGLGYEDVVWDKPPDPSRAPERWQDFKLAYEDWVRGNYIRPPPSSTLSANLRRVRALPFQEKVLLKEQPESLNGGELMAYQLDGLNWLYYQWHKGQNAILADEMGLGKTIQVIGLLSVLQEKHHCWPALVVVPNSTCPNWKREIRRWAPSLRVVTYFGPSKALELTEKYELFRENQKDVKCHVVITSYEGAQGAAMKGLRRIHWQTLVVDEGQRLKNDEGLLYQALSALRIPFKLLLTGTPLQNNQRELFNLLQFLDPSKNAQALEVEYQVLNKENIVKLHNLLRPFFLRRTKAQVLDFLPTMAQIIVPVSMSALQKELYKSILAKNADLLQSIFGGEKRATAKGGLRNILMQLRKCLCHPFVYNSEIEERTQEAAVSHQRLVEASSKLQLLELMLPKLRERGHRVLIFSQFLDMLTIVEDFLEDLGLEHLRLDGSLTSLERQHRIDAFNAEDSSVFAFLLSTRAGGVGINLATADTVIILDPDFNPHQDIQAISRAHRIGQKKKVLVFQLMTRASAEEKIMQIGRKKLALDHALIESMEVEEENMDDLEAVLQFGAQALFKDDDSSDVRYDTGAVETLLDRSQVENTRTDQDKTSESQFSFARVWQNDSAAMVDVLGAPEDDQPPIGVWDQILAERARQVEIEAARKAEKLGRGKRHRKEVDYLTDDQFLPEERPTDADTDFQAQPDSEGDHDDSDMGVKEVDPVHVEKPLSQKSRSKILTFEVPKSSLQRVTWPLTAPESPPLGAPQCPACDNRHIRGYCPLKIAGHELCGLCGTAHFGHQRICPHLNSEIQVRLMLKALDESPEPSELIERARKMLKALKGNLVQLKKKEIEKRQREGNASGSLQNRPKAPPMPDKELVTPLPNPVYQPHLQHHPRFAPTPPSAYPLSQHPEMTPAYHPQNPQGRPYQANGVLWPFPGSQTPQAPCPPAPQTMPPPIQQDQPKDGARPVKFKTLTAPTFISNGRDPEANISRPHAG